MTARTLTGFSSGMTLSLFSATLFLSAVLLFVVQPFFSKMVLPILGGAPAVWNTALMFFQGMLLAGYLYAHVLTRHLGVRKQSIIHGVLLVLAFISLPIVVSSEWTPPVESTPVFWLLALFTVSIGLPFFVVSSTAPLLQRWFSHTSHPHASDPYFLYGASNLGALLALLGYPVVVEPLLGLDEQSRAWSNGYLLLILLIGMCAVSTWRNNSSSASSVSSTAANEDAESNNKTTTVTWKRCFRWMILAFVPSALLLGVTLHLTIDVAAAPFIWVIPLALFLLTFVLVFARKPLLKHEWMLRTQVWVYIVLAIYFTADDLWLAFGLHLLTLFVTAMVCHGELARLRPPPNRLTEFYLWLSLGGWLGGVFGAILAPMLFDTVIEYPLIIILAYLVRPRVSRSDTRSYLQDFVLPLVFAVFFFLPSLWPAFNPAALGAIGPLGFYIVVAAVLYSFRTRPLRFVLALTCVIFAWDLVDDRRNVLARERSFFGVYEVRTTETGNLHMLNHGTTLHGAQPVDPAYANYPLSYYHTAGPFGQVIKILNNANQLKSAGVVGLGIGTIACYMQPGQKLTFFEIDPVVETIARNTEYFSYLHHCGDNVDVILGDGRRTLAQVPDNSFDLLLLDAFSSDAVPVHLLTREALTLYLEKLSGHGILMFNISNRYVHLAPVLARLAEDANLVVLRQSFWPGPKQVDQGALDSEWIIMARNPDVITVFMDDERWQSITLQAEQSLWTDDYSNLFRALVWHRLLWKR
jgi:spermidine synthase